MQITELIDRIHSIDEKGNVLVKQLSDDEVAEINHANLWQCNGVRKHQNCDVHFGDKSWPKTNRSKMFFSGDKAFGVELRCAFLLAHKIGFVLGGDGLAWNTTYRHFNYLTRLEKYLYDKGYRSFRELSKLPELILRNLAGSFLTTGVDNGGLDILKSKSTASRFLESLTIIYRYGLINDIAYSSFANAVAALETPSRNEFSNSHPVIPTGVLKKLFKQASEYIKQAEKALPEWEKANANLLASLESAISEKHTSNIPLKLSELVRPYLTCREAQNLAELSKHFELLDVYVLVYVLAYTGMRQQEALALEPGAALKPKQPEGASYYIKSILRKTTPVPVTLKWVGNQDVYNAVYLLERFNESLHKRAEAFLRNFADSLSEDSKHNLEYGLAEKYLFGVKGFSTSLLYREPKLRDGWVGGRAFNLKSFSIIVEEADIVQLNHLGCNFKSLVGKNRGAPYQVGDEFNFTAHQFRHTFAWFIIANRLGDLDDIKYQYKHLVSAMTMVYSERGIETIDELLGIVEGFEKQMTQQISQRLAKDAQEGKLSGGGGKRLVKAANSLIINIKMSSEVDNETKTQPLK